MRVSILLYTFCLLTILTGCTENTGSNVNTLVSDPSQQQVIDTFVVEPAVDSGDLKDLFTFHKKLNLNDDISFDVLGLGTLKIGSYLILKSDKRKGTYTTVTGEKIGRIVHAYATDMDTDQQIEVIIFTKTGNDQKGNLIIHEIDSLNNHTKIMLPELTTNLADGYQGQDTFYVRGNRIIREFPVSATSETSTVRSKRIEYVLNNNAFLPSAQGEQ